MTPGQSILFGTLFFGWIPAIIAVRLIAQGLHKIGNGLDTMDVVLMGATFATVWAIAFPVALVAVSAGLFWLIGRLLLMVIR